jgi:hypothetical protein
MAYMLFQLLSGAVDSVTPIVGSVLLLRRSPWTPPFFKAYLGFMVFAGLVDMSALRLLYGSISVAFEAGGQSLGPLDAATDQKFLDGLRAAAYGSIWLAYWCRSTRVRQLFNES